MFRFLTTVILFTLIIPVSLLSVPHKADAAATISKTLTRPINEIGLVGWWTFDGPDTLTNVADKSGQEDTGLLLHSGSGTTTAPGKIGQALTFDGINDYVTLGASYNGVQTVAFWIQVSTSTTLQKILDLNGTATVTIDSGTLNGNNFTSPTRYVDGAAASTINDTNWHHVAITTGTGINASAMDIGRISAAYLGGSLDDVRIYSRALSAAEVTRLYQIGATSKIAKTLQGRDSLTSGLVGWWTFDGPDTLTNIIDKSAEGNHGFLVHQGSGTTTTSGPIGQAFGTDGSNDYVNAGSAASLDDIQTKGNGGMSVSLWLKVRSYVVVNPHLIAKPDVNTTAGRWGIRIESSTARFRFFKDFNGATDMTIASANNTFTTAESNKWHHMVFTWASTTDASASGTFYLNNVALSMNNTNATANSGPVSDASTNLGILNAAGTTVAPIDGYLDDVRLYNRILSTTEITQLYQLGATSKISKTLQGRDSLTSGLVGWWTMDGPDTLTNIADKSGQGDTGNLIHGGSGTTTAPGKVGQALTFDGVNDYVTLGASYNGVQSVAFWIQVSTSTTLQKILDLNGTATVTIDSGTLNGNNFTSPTRYVDGAAASTIDDTNWHHVAITTGTGINASAMDIGRISAAYLGGSLDDVRVYSRALSAAEVLQLYNLGR